MTTGCSGKWTWRSTTAGSGSQKIWLKIGAESTMTLSGFQFFYVPENAGPVGKFVWRVKREEQDS